MQALPAGGVMTSVMADEVRVMQAIAGSEDTVAIAAINAPGQVVISGAGAAVAEITARLTADGIKTKALTVSHAFHSPLMEPMLAPFEDAAKHVQYHPSSVPIVSNVTGAILPAGEVRNAAYWRRHVRAPVRFADGVNALYDYGCRIFLEVGPAPVLIGMGKRVVTSKDAVWLHSLEKETDGARTMLTSLARLYVGGVDVDWSAVNPARPGSFVSAGTYGRLSSVMRRGRY